MASSSSSTMILVAGSALLVAAAASFMPRQLGATDVEEEEMITEELICKIFDRLFMEMQAVVASLSQQIQQIQMNGQMIPESQIRKIIKGEFERALLLKQAKVFADFDVDAECVEEATWEFLRIEGEYPKVKKVVERFQKLYDNVTGERTTGSRPGSSAANLPREVVETMQPDKLLKAADAYFGAMTDAMRGLVEKYKAEGKDLKQATVAQELHMEFASMVTEAGEKALEDLGVSAKVFQASIEKHASNPQVGRALSMLQMKQQQDLMALGVIPM
eukprot:CAMPEP_0116554032 /NCGR_PEP_ID=MMETSP0397-20121206/7368_1 /TAXON_ID=216820 /ORGANISM="Cyclophora tenuis, Strain ECT3854" /LENGTH=274 /DNA_ID=CAMNT_0004079151 /DNA_START=70 /DNA_END=894 /DNA_ORIENTATION=-